MDKRDFDHEFGEMMVGLAATDPDLVDHYRTKLFDPQNLEAFPGEQSAVCGDIRWHYPMNEQQMKRAIGRCVVGLIDGVELGEDFFAQNVPKT